jgi:hypothetical protein
MSWTVFTYVKLLISSSNSFSINMINIMRIQDAYVI